ncbi:MAG: hypothetical protein K1W24_07830 [Lachnospiraceae bacterium]
MRQYEFAIRIAQIHHLVEERKFKKALAVIRTLDMRQVKGISDLTIIADVFAKTEQFDSAKEAYLKIYNKSKTRRIVQKLAIISIRTKDLDAAERYYQEFVKMNPSTRDVIVLRYRIDKAAGVHIGKLVETLEELKEEEYIEEWAYELAKLYYKAGRFEECRKECEDILLWFGHGEIVERARKLIEYVDDKEAMPYIDDRDYTVDRNEPNPDDTGSLPDLHEYLKNMKQEEENRKKHLKDRKAREQESKQEDNIKENGQYKKMAETAATKEPAANQQGNGNVSSNNNDTSNQEDFIDDYEEDDFEIDAGFGKLAQKLTGFLHIGGKKEKKRDTEDTDSNSEDPFSEGEYVVENSGKENLNIKIRINKDLYNKTIEQAKNLEKESIENRQDETGGLNLLTDSTDTGNGNNTENTITANGSEDKNQKPAEQVYFNSGMGITQDLSREISAIYEAEHGHKEPLKEQLKEQPVKQEPAGSRRPLKRDATKVIERMTRAVKTDENKNLPSAGIEETVETEEKLLKTEKNILTGNGSITTETESITTEAESVITKTEDTIIETENIITETSDITTGLEKKAVEEPEKDIIAEEKNIEENVTKQNGKSIMPQFPEMEDNSILVSKEEIDLAEMEAKKAHEEALIKAEEARAIVEEARRKAEEAARMLAEIEKKHAAAGTVVLQDKIITTEETREEETAIKDIIEENITERIRGEISGIKDAVEENITERTQEETAIEDTLEENIIKETITDADITKIQRQEKSVTEDVLQEDIPGEITEDGTRSNKDYEDIDTEEDYEEDWPLEEDYEEDGLDDTVPEEGLSNDDLPTTRALHTSFNDILTLIGGEPDPSHFVFVGNTFDLITGLSKKIVKVMKETGYMSAGRIARISAKNLNKMNLPEFKSQLKGNCLLIDEAADLMIPTIAGIFEIMDEYYGDFVVILADNGNTLDQLFKFAPALAKRFKYIIDISGYTEEDCK